MSVKQAFTLSSLSLLSESEDWDRSESDRISVSAPPPNGHGSSSSGTMPRNPVAFPFHELSSAQGCVSRLGTGAGAGRSLSELMRLHAEKGTDVSFTPEEASRVADVLKQWVRIHSLSFPFPPFPSDGPVATLATALTPERGDDAVLPLFCRFLCRADDAPPLLQINSGTSPYEGEDDFFARAFDDSTLALRRSPCPPPADGSTRPRGQSESAIMPALQAHRCQQS